MNSNNGSKDIHIAYFNTYHQRDLQKSNSNLSSNDGNQFFFLSFFLFLKKLFVYFLAALGLCCCAQAFSSCGERELLFVAVCRLLVAVASLVVEHGL